MGHDAHALSSQRATDTNGRSPWRLFPLWIGLTFVPIVAVNGYLAYSALSTYPGAAVADDFGTSNRYDQILAQAERQAALGWHVEAALQDSRPVLSLAGPDHRPLDGAAITGTAQHPLGPSDTVALSFAAQAPGGYVATTALGAGRWDLLLRITQNGRTIAVTRHVTVR